MSNCYKNIVISRTDKIGDLVLSIPAISALRIMYPEAKIYVLVRKYNAPIVSCLSSVDEVIIYDNYTLKELSLYLRSKGVDTFISLYSNFKIGLLSFLSGAAVRSGPLSKIHSWFFYNKGIKQRRSLSIKNEAEYNLDLVRNLDAALYDSMKFSWEKVCYKEANRLEAERFLQSNKIDNPFILIHPFSGGSAKNYTIDEYMDLIDEVYKLMDKVDIVISSSVYDRDKVSYIKERNPRVFVYESKSLLDLAALIDKCEVYVGGSTGPSHIAGSLGKKCVCIYPVKASMSPVRWGLFGNESRTVYIIPDENNAEEDYSHKEFDKITAEIIKRTAEKIKEQYNGQQA